MRSPCKDCSFTGDRIKCSENCEKLKVYQKFLGEPTLLEIMLHARNKARGIHHPLADSSIFTDTKSGQVHPVPRFIVDQR